MRARSFVLPLGLGALVVAVAACGSDGSAPRADGAVASAFAASARANGVPRDLMLAIAQTEGALAMPARRDVQPDAAVPAAGPLQLRHGRFDSLARGAALMHASELALRRDTDLGLEAAARVLADVGARLGARGDDLASWERAIEEMSGYADDAHRAAYAHRVFALLARGGALTARDGEVIVLPAHDLPPHLTVDLASGLRLASAGAEYAGAEWFPTDCANKCTLDRGGNAVSTIVIHDTEGGWDASVATLQNDPGKSVHYIVGTDGHVGQFVHEDVTAWHAGNYFVNQRSIGIEHVGFMNQAFTEAQYAASATLVTHLAAKYGVKKDRAHVIGHDQVPNGNAIAESAPPCDRSPKECEASASYGGSSNHRDPGDWEWATYMPRIGAAAKCDDVGSLWNCSHDRTQAFRCASDRVEVEACDGPGACETQPLGVDDVCHRASAPAADGGDVDAAAGGRGGSGGAQIPQPIASSADDSDGGGITLAATADVSASSGGCRAAPARAGSASDRWMALATVGALVVLRRARRRTRRG